MKLIILLVITSVVYSEINFEEVNSLNGFSIIKYDEADIVSEYNYIIHTVNLTDLYIVVNKITQEIDSFQKILPSRIYSYSLEEELKIIKEELKTIKGHKKTNGRFKRSLLNIGGRFLNVLFGTMDDRDKTRIEKQLRINMEDNFKLIKNNNKQIFINDNLQKGIEAMQTTQNRTAKEINSLTKKYVETSERLLTLELQRKLDKIKEFIEKLQNIILASRLQVMTESLLTSDEIEVYEIDLNKLKNIKLTIGEYTEELLVFIIQIPDEIMTFDKYLIAPIPNEKYEQLDFKPEIVIKIDSNLYIYEENKKLKHLKRYRNCIDNNNCLKVINKEENIVSELRRGTLLVINSYLKINNSCDERKTISIKRNMLINFRNCKLLIKNIEYSNNNKYVIQPIDINMENHFNISNAQYKSTNMNISKIDNIDYIESKFVTQRYINYSISLTTVMIIILTLIILTYVVKKKLFQEKQPANGGVVMLDNDSTEAIPMKHIPSIFAVRCAD